MLYEKLKKAGVWYFRGIGTRGAPLEVHFNFGLKLQWAKRTEISFSLKFSPPSPPNQKHLITLSLNRNKTMNNNNNNNNAQK